MIGGFFLSWRNIQYSANQATWPISQSGGLTIARRGPISCSVVEISDEVESPGAKFAHDWDQIAGTNSGK